MAPRSFPQTLSVPTLPEQQLLAPTLSLKTLPPGLIHGGIYSSLQHDKTGASEEVLGRKDLPPKMLKEKTHSPPTTLY